MRAIVTTAVEALWWQSMCKKKAAEELTRAARLQGWRAGRGRYRKAAFCIGDVEIIWREPES
jgi:hypothetical protein